MKRITTLLQSMLLYLKTLLFDLSFQHYISLQIIPLGAPPARKKMVRDGKQLP